MMCMVNFREISSITSPTHVIVFDSPCLQNITPWKHIGSHRCVPSHLMSARTISFVSVSFRLISCHDIRVGYMCSGSLGLVFNWCCFVLTCLVLVGLFSQVVTVGVALHGVVLTLLMCAFSSGVISFRLASSSVGWFHIVSCGNELCMLMPRMLLTYCIISCAEASRCDCILAMHVHIHIF